MGYSAYLDIDGVGGASVAVGHEGQVDILSYSFGSPTTSVSGLGKGSGSGSVVQNSFSITKYVDAASAELWTRCANGKKTAKMTLTVEKRVENKVISKITYTFTDVYVTSTQIGATHGDDKAVETVSFSFGKMQYTVFRTDDDKKLQNAGTGGWSAVGP